MKIKSLLIIVVLVIGVFCSTGVVSAQTSTTYDQLTQQLIQTLTQLIAQLQQEINVILAQRATITPTAPTACVPNWQCAWGPCTNGYQSEVVTDSNNCGLSLSTAMIACPALARVCTYSTQPSITITLPVSGTLSKGTMQTISWQVTSSSQLVGSYNLPVDISITSSDGSSYTIASGVSTSYNWYVGNFPYPDGGLKVYSVPAGYYTLKVCQTGTNNCSSGTAINLVDMPISQNTIDLGSMFPYQETPGCPSSDYVRTYTTPAFSYPVIITTSTNVHADDYLKINGIKTWETSASDACGDSRLVSSTELQTPGYNLGTVIPAGTPIRIDLVDTVGMVSGASGKLSINQVNAYASAQPTVAPVQSTVVSGQNIKLSLSSSYASHSSLYFVCPAGISMIASPESTSVNICNTYMDVTSLNYYSPFFTNSTPQSLNVAVNYTVYAYDGSTMPAVGSANITVLPNSNTITVTSPNGGENFVSGSGHANIISWKGGSDKVQIGLVDSRFATDRTILGWVFLSGVSNSSGVWDGQRVSDLTGTVFWPVSSLSSGPFKILAVSADANGNYCAGNIGTGTCNYDLSDNYFNIVAPY